MSDVDSTSTTGSGRKPAEKISSAHAEPDPSSNGCGWVEDLESESAARDDKTIARHPDKPNRYGIWKSDKKKPLTTGPVLLSDSPTSLEKRVADDFRRIGIALPVPEPLLNLMEARAKKDRADNPTPREYFYETESGGLGPLEVVKLARDVERPTKRVRSGPDGGLYRYDSGVYRGDGNEVVRHTANKYLDYLTRSSHVVEIVKYFENRESIDPLSFDPPRELAIRAANGILRLSRDPENPVKEIEDYTPDNAWLARTPWNYDPDAPEPVEILRFLRDVFIIWNGEKWVPDTDTINYLLALIGLGMIPRNVLRRAILLHGKGRNGKSILLHIIGHLYGLENVSAVSLEALGSNRFAAAELRGRLANICGDISSNGGKDSSLFKQMTGDDRVYGERKFGQPFEFTCGAMPFWSCNVYPRSSDVTPAYMGRWSVIHFPLQFEENARKEQELKALAEDKSEMQGLLRLTVECAVKLLSHPKPTTDAVPESMQKAKKRFQQNIDTVRAFTDEALIKDPAARIEGKQAYGWYIQYVEGAGMGKVGRNNFYQRLEALEGIERNEVTTGNKLWFTGVELNESWTAESGVDDKFAREFAESAAIPHED